MVDGVSNLTLHDCVFSGIAPVIEPSPDNIEIEEGDEVKLTCKTRNSGYPKPFLLWYRNGKLLKLDEHRYVSCYLQGTK